MKLFVSARGEGPPVLLLHSGGMSSRQWKKLGDALASTHRVLAPDLFGQRDRLWEAGDPAFHELNDLLQYLDNSRA